MIKPNEFRIGNYAYEEHCDGSKHVAEVSEISHSGKVKSKRDWRITEPIPLTEEWLLRLGFEWYNPLNHYRLIVGDLWLSVDKDFYFTFVNLAGDETKNMPPKKINFVHRLQNIVFELTDHELTINPKQP